MSDITKVFCTKLTGISLRKLLDELNKSGLPCNMVDDQLDLDLESPMWSKASLTCIDSPGQIMIEHYIAGLHGTVIEDETEHLLTRVESMEESWGKREVLIYLRMSRELLVLEVDGHVEEGDKAMKVAERCASLFGTIGEGVSYLEGEGFFNKGELLLSLYGY